MQAVWSGSAGTPNVTLPNFAFVTNPFGVAMVSNSPNAFNAVEVCFPLSDDIVITGITAWVATAPGAGVSWTMSIQTSTTVTYSGTGSFTNTAASATISGTNTTASWQGTAPIAQSTFVTVALVPSGGTPASTAAVYWVINYQTAGNFYLVPAATAASYATNGTGTYYDLAFGMSSSVPTTTASSFAVPAPTSFTVTKLIAWCNVQSSLPFGSASKTFTIYNATTSTASSFSAVATGSATGLSSIGVGSMSFTPGQLLSIQVSFITGTPYCADYICMTVVPSNSGEIVAGYATTAAPSTSVANYEDPYGSGANAWNATEPSVYARFPASTLKNLYVSLASAPGTGTSYTFTLRSGGTSSTGITATVSGTATTANDTSHTAILPFGTLLDMQAVPTSTPAATSGVAFGFVEVIAQSSSNFLELW
jgi:hypothetical protein